MYYYEQARKAIWDNEEYWVTSVVNQLVELYDEALDEYTLVDYAQVRILDEWKWIRVER